MDANLEKISEMWYNGGMGSILWKNRKTGGGFLTLIVAAVYSLVNLVTPVLALSQDNLRAADLDRSYFYDPEVSNCRISRPSGKDVTWIGDSYSVGAEYNDHLITKKLSGVDLGAYNDTDNPPADSYIKGNKLFADDKNDMDSDNPTGIALLKKITNENTLRPYLVFALGVNGGVTEESINELINLAGANTKIVLTTSYTTTSDYAATNDLLKKAAANYNNVTVADWASVAKSEYYKDDGIHPFGNYDKWVDVIYEALPEGGNGGNSSTNISVSGNKLYNGNAVISDDLMARVKENQPFYEAAAKKYGFPWQIIAVLHINETGARRYNPANGQGVYQLFSYTGGGTNSNAFAPADTISDAEFTKQTEIVAGLVSNGYGAGLDLNTESGVKRLFFQYNGTAAAYVAQARDLGFTEEEAEWGEGSPYVMNMADERRDPTKNSNWKQIITDGGSPVNSPAHTRPGAYVLYMALGGVGSMCSVVGGGNGDINQTAILLSWSDNSHDPFKDPKPEYKTALAETGVNRLGDSCSMNGNSCDAFAATVLRYSGVDEDFPCCGVSLQSNYLASHPELYEEIPNIGSAENMQPGDIRIKPGQHIEIYVVLDDGTGAIASASHCDRTGDHATPYYADGGYKIYRKR